MRLNLSRFDSPLGELLIVTDVAGLLRALDFSDCEARLRGALRERYPGYELVATAAPPGIAEPLANYFAGSPSALEQIAVAVDGSRLQQAVWAAVRRIAPGSTTSYGELARSLGYADPRAAIDVGAAVAANPVAIVVPCHRVIGKNGDLKGYAWGVRRKSWLLSHEGAWPRQLPAELPATARLPGF